MYIKSSTAITCVGFPSAIISWQRATLYWHTLTLSMIVYSRCTREDGDSEAVGRHNGMSDLYRSVHGPSSTAVCAHVLSQVY